MRTPTLLLAALLAVPAAAAPSPVDALVDEGGRKLEGGDLAGALDAFARAEKLAPRDPRPHYLRGAALQKKGDVAGAEKGFKEALALDPKLAEVRGELGALYTDAHRYPEAIAELRRAVAEKADLSAAWYNLGASYSAQQKCPEALDAYHRAIALEPDAESYITYSVALRKCKKLPEATAAAREAVKRAPPGPAAVGAHISLGLLLGDQGKDDDAVAELSAATKLDPKERTAWWALGLAEMRRKRYEPAIGALTRARALAPLPPYTDDLGRAYRDQGDFARAEPLFREAAGKGYAPARWHLAQTLAVQHKCGELSHLLDELPPAEGKGAPAAELRKRCGEKKP
jgi:tetratricopeptide (TPR) repeat protein